MMQKYQFLIMWDCSRFCKSGHICTYDSSSSIVKYVYYNDVYKFCIAISVVSISIAPPTSDAAPSSSETPNAGATTTLTTGATTTLTTDAPTTDATTAPTTATGSSSSFRNYFYISIFLLLILVPAAYVYYQNREKVIVQYSIELT